MIALFEDLFIFNTLASINYDTVKKSALPRDFLFEHFAYFLTQEP